MADRDDSANVTRSAATQPRRKVIGTDGIIVRSRRAAQGSGIPSLAAGNCIENRAHVVQRVRLLRRLVRAPSQHAGKPDRKSAPVARGAGDGLETELEDMERLDVPDGPETLPR